MPLHDYACEACGTRIVDRLEPRLDTPPPECPIAARTMAGEMTFHFAGQDLTVTMDPAELAKHKMVRLWTRRHGTRGFKKFLHEDQSGKPIEIDSLAAVRRYEKQTGDRAAAGLGQPEVFRQFSQDQSNRDVNVFGKPNFRKPRTTTRRGIPLVSVKEDFVEVGEEGE